MIDIADIVDRHPHLFHYALNKVIYLQPLKRDPGHHHMSFLKEKTLSRYIGVHMEKQQGQQLLLLLSFILEGGREFFVSYFEMLSPLMSHFSFQDSVVWVSVN